MASCRWQLYCRLPPVQILACCSLRQELASTMWEMEEETEGSATPTARQCRDEPTAAAMFTAGIPAHWSRAAGGRNHQQQRHDQAAIALPSRPCLIRKSALAARRISQPQGQPGPQDHQATSGCHGRHGPDRPQVATRSTGGPWVARACRGGATRRLNKPTGVRTQMGTAAAARLWQERDASGGRLRGPGCMAMAPAGSLRSDLSACSPLPREARHLPPAGDPLDCGGRAAMAGGAARLAEGGKSRSATG